MSDKEKGAKSNKYRYHRGGHQGSGNKSKDGNDRAEKGLDPTLPFLRPCDGGNPAFTIDWFKAMRTFAIKTYVKGVDLVFDHNDPREPYMDEPQFTDESEEGLEEFDTKTKREILMQKWRAKHNAWTDWNKHKENDLPRAFGLGYGQMSRASIDRLTAFEPGKIALDSMSMAETSRAIMATHFSGGKSNELDNFYVSETNFNKLAMHEEESLTTYHHRFSACHEALREAARAAEKQDKLPDNDQLVMKFVYTLSRKYSEYRDAFERKLVPAPETLIDALTKIQSFGKNKSISQAQWANYKGVFVAKGGGRYGGRGGGRDGGRGGGRDGGKGGGRGNCFRCGKPDHWQYDCPENEDNEVSEAVTAAKKSSARKQKN